MQVVKRLKSLLQKAPDALLCKEAVLLDVCANKKLQVRDADLGDQVVKTVARIMNHRLEVGQVRRRELRKRLYIVQNCLRVIQPDP
eukprot:XP_001707358.1 Hypothetical protein GL50803_16825 [Giardia lamblia ATCC 50803]